jgi:two-component system phosphate regulon sensor histidine kinase PhoR
MEKIFEQFYRTEDSAELNEWGAGLGLFMVRTFVMRYGGDVQVESRHGEGSRFRVRFLRQAPLEEARGGA